MPIFAQKLPQALCSVPDLEKLRTSYIVPRIEREKAVYSSIVLFAVHSLQPHVPIFLETNT